MNVFLEVFAAFFGGALGFGLAAAVTFLVLLAGVRLLDRFKND